MPTRVVRRPHTIGGRRIQDIIERLRSEEADLRDGIYIRPKGDGGLHVVRQSCSTTEIVVASALRGETFRPGSSLLLGSHAGESSLSIVAAPPPGKKGASGFPFLQTSSRAQRPTLLSMSPRTLPPGFLDIVTFFGSDLSEDPVDVLTAVIYDEDLAKWVADPLVDVTNPITWTDSETVSATVSVDQGSPSGRAIWIDASRAS